MFKHLNTRIPKRIEQEKDKVSAVMIPLIKENDGYHILFEVRSNKLSQQPGEICFPGGRREQDETSMETSIRETCEELLILNLILNYMAFRLLFISAVCGSDLILGN